MGTSGTTTFNLTVDEIIEDAYERLGVFAPSGADMRSARRSLNLVLQDFTNAHPALWTRDTDSQVCGIGITNYALDADILDVADVTCTSSSGSATEISLTRITDSDWRAIPSKAQEGRPSLYWVDRQRDQPTLYVWPAPDDTYTMYFRTQRRIEDVGSYTNTLDIPAKALNAIIAALTVQLSTKKAPERKAELAAEAFEALQRLMDEDRERVSLFLRPGG